MTYVVITVLAFVTAALQYQLWLGDYGVARLYQLRGAVAAQQQENSGLQQRNQVLVAEVVDLQQGSAGVEERARSELGMVKPGEAFFQVVENRGRPPEKSAARR
jgi:cell division protein FtsB